MPATILQRNTPSAYNLYMDSGLVRVHFWDVVIGEYGNPTIFRALVDAIFHAKEYGLPINPINVTPEQYKRISQLCEQHGVTIVVPGADETVIKNYR